VEFRVSRRRFLLGSSILTGAALFDSGALNWPEGSVAASPVPTVRGIPLLDGGLGYPGLADQAVLGAELQYFRMTPSDIPARLALCQQAHYSVIQTYVPWNVHEYVQGIYDFTGRFTPVLPDSHVDEWQIEDPISQTEAAGFVGRSGITANSNLEAYLHEVAAGGFKMILRPGPFISDEWCNGGMPYWMLAEGDPTMFEYGPDGSAISPDFPFSPPVAIATGGGPLYYFPSPSYASTVFLGRTKEWLTAFVEFLTAGNWFHEQGGPVVGLQVDDESCFFYKFAPFQVDYNPAMLERWADYAPGVDPPRAWPDPSEGTQSLKVPLLWQRFKGEQQAAYLGLLAANLVAAGATVPINHELEQDMVPPADMWNDAGQIILNGEFYQGSDASILPSNEIIAQSVRAASRQMRPTYATEMDNGDPLLYALLIGEGIYGGLQFTYVEGVPDGALDVLTVIGQTYEAAGPMLGSATRRADVAVVWDPRQTHLPFGTDRWGFRTDVRSVVEKHMPALVTLLIRAGYSFDFLDTSGAEAADLARYPTIFYAASDVCPSAFQDLLVDYVADGGRLVCWPAPPSFDENLDLCSTLANACFPEQAIGDYPVDGIEISLGDLVVPVWRGVTTYQLSPSATEIATVEGTACGYRLPHGSGETVLLGSWLAADSVCGRDGDILEEVDALPGTSSTIALAQLASKYLSAEAAAMVPDELPGGEPQSYQVWYYANQRQGGEVISSGCLSYFDGENVVGLVELNNDPTEPLLQTFPYHPILPSHIAAVRQLANVVPQVTANDTHIQARVLDGPSGSATVVVCNRFNNPIETVLETVVDGELVRLPLKGTFTVPPTTGLLCPVNYPLGEGRDLLQAVGQFLGATSSQNSLVLGFWAPADGEVVLALEAIPTSVTVDGAPALTQVLSRSPVKLAVAFPAGSPQITLEFD
jgi:hypothetical protein